MNKAPQLTIRDMTEATLTSDIHRRPIMAAELIPLGADVPKCLAPYIGSNTPVGEMLQGSTWLLEFKTQSHLKVFQTFRYHRKDFVIERIESVWSSGETNVLAIRARHESATPSGYNFSTDAIRKWFRVKKKVSTQR
jgi:hypothetical protein